MKKLLILLSALVLAPAGSVATAQAGPGIRNEWRYYDTPDLKYLSGQIIEYCDGRYYRYGHLDAYEVHEEGSCPE